MAEPLRPTKEELAFARQAIKEKQLREDALSALIRIAENIPVTERGKQGKKKSTPGPDADAATLKGAYHYGRGDPWPTIERGSCSLIPGFRDMSPERQDEERLKLRHRIEQHVYRYKIRRPKK